MTQEKFQEKLQAGLDRSVRRVYETAVAYYEQRIASDNCAFEKHPVLKKGVTVGNKRSATKLPSLADLLRVASTGKRRYYSPANRARPTFYLRMDESGTLHLYGGYTSLSYVEELDWDKLSRDPDRFRELERVLGLVS